MRKCCARFLTPRARNFSLQCAKARLSGGGKTNGVLMKLLTGAEISKYLLLDSAY